MFGSNKREGTLAYNRSSVEQLVRLTAKWCLDEWWASCSNRSYQLFLWPASVSAVLAAPLNCSFTWILDEAWAFGSVLLSVSPSLSVLQEAVSTRDPELVRLVLRYRDYQRTAKRLAGIPVLLERLRQVGFHTQTHAQAKGKKLNSKDCTLSETNECACYLDDIHTKNTNRGGLNSFEM